MDEKNYLITDEEITENGVESAPHYVSGDPDEVQKIFDKLPKLIADKLNSFISAVIKKFTDYYTKTEAEAVIDEKVAKMTNGGMSTYTYDKNNDGVVDNAEKVGGFWFAFEDAEGNATEELHVHYYVDENGNVVTTPIT